MKRVLTTLAAAAVAVGLVHGSVPASAQAPAAQSGPATTTRVDDGQQAIGYGAGWTTQQDSAAYGGGLHVTGQAQAGASLTFTGVSVKVVTKKGPRAGILDVYVDGAKVRSFDTWAPEHQYGVVAFQTARLPLGRHTVEVRNSGRTNEESTGSVAHLDYIDTTDRPGAQAYADQWAAAAEAAGMRYLIYTTARAGG